MLKKILAILALIGFVLVMIDVFFVRFAIEIVLPIYIIALIAGVIIVIFKNTAAASRKASEARNAEAPDGEADAD